jgi:hypothetical protein
MPRIVAAESVHESSIATVAQQITQLQCANNSSRGQKEYPYTTTFRARLQQSLHTHGNGDSATAANPDTHCIHCCCERSQPLSREASCLQVNRVYQPHSKPTAEQPEGLHTHCCATHQHSSLPDKPRGAPAQPMHQVYAARTHGYAACTDCVCLPSCPLCASADCCTVISCLITYCNSKPKGTCAAAWRTIANRIREADHCSTSRSNQRQRWKMRCCFCRVRNRCLAYDTLAWSCLCCMGVSGSAPSNSCAVSSTQTLFVTQRTAVYSRTPGRLAAAARNSTTQTHLVWHPTSPETGCRMSTPKYVWLPEGSNICRLSSCQPVTFAPVGDQPDKVLQLRCGTSRAHMRAAPTSVDT